MFLTPLIIFETDLVFAEVTKGLSNGKTLGVVAQSTWLNMTSINTSGISNSLLVVSISIDDKEYPGSPTVVNSVTLANGTCSTPQALTLVPGSVSTNADEVSTRLYYKVNPQSSSNCDILINFNQNHGRAGFTYKPASGTWMLFSGVNQTHPFLNSQTNINTGLSTSSTISPKTIPDSIHTDDLILDVVSASVGNANPTTGASQTNIKSSFVQNVFKRGTSYQDGSIGTPLTWQLDTGAGNGGTNVQWAASVMVIRAFFGSAVSIVSGGGDDNGSCSGDCTPPTLGIDKNNKRVVSGGFSFNDNPVDAELYYTPYPLITAYVGEENTIALRIHENDGPQNLAHVGIAFGLGHGESFSQSQAIINWDRNYDGTEMVYVIDPKHVLENVRVESDQVACDDIGSECIDIIFYHTFRAPLEFNMVATDIWDYDRNAWQNYFNHGVQVVGESLNPANVHTGIYKGKIYHLTEIEKTKSVDDDGNTWTFDYGIWNKNYVDVKKTDPELVNPDKIWAINHVLKDNSIDDSSDTFSYNRYHNQFETQKEYQIILAESLLEEMCPKCFDDEFAEIDDISYYEFDEVLKRYDDLDFVGTIEFEAELAENLLEEMMNSFYPGRVFEEDNFD